MVFVYVAKNVKWFQRYPKKFKHFFLTIWKMCALTFESFPTMMEDKEDDHCGLSQSDEPLSPGTAQRLSKTRVRRQSFCMLAVQSLNLSEVYSIHLSYMYWPTVSSVNKVSSENDSYPPVSHTFTTNGQSEVKTGETRALNLFQHYINRNLQGMPNNEWSSSHML